MLMKSMKKTAVLLLLSFLILSFTGCAGLAEFSVKEHTAEKLQELSELFTPEGYQQWIDGLVSDMQDLLKLMKGEEDEVDSADVPDIYNIILIGSDRRDTSWNGNSDTMILLSINKSAKTIHMISFMRDTGVVIPGSGYGKMNWAFAKGGASLLISTIETNFGIPIHSYVSVDFTGMIQVIDQLGGITVEVTEAEKDTINNGAGSYYKSQGIDPAPYMLPSAGTVHLNGIQTLTYSRDRSSGGNDYGRTSRQRQVLTALLNQCRGNSLSWYISIVPAVFQSVQQNFSAEQITYLTSILPVIDRYTIVSDRIPYDGLYGCNAENLDPVQPDTNSRLQAELGY